MVPPTGTSLSPGRGITFTILGGALLTTNDAVLKWLTSDYPVGQLMFIRGLFVFLPVMLIVWRAGGFGLIRVNSFRDQSLRAGFAFTSGFCFITGISFLPLADALAITFAGPLFVTALAPPMLGETVGWRRWSAVLVGFAGVVVMLRPGAEAVQWAALFPLGASLAGALRDLTTRQMAGRETSVSIMCFSTAVIVLALGDPFRVRHLGRPTRCLDDDRGRHRDRWRALHHPPREPPPNPRQSSAGGETVKALDANFS